MSKKHEEKRDLMIVIRLSKGELKAIDNEAKKAGKNRSELLRSVAYLSSEQTGKPEGIQKVA